ncbi:MAG: peptidoglycan DD-metalloendopeptidase family protein [Anaerolineae bacterium]|nr:peptidoglycan DD-metalloendopeptidase family protein [Anaerolineae bacterium]
MTRIFISYRRADSEAITGRIYDHLVQALGQEQVFQDVESIPAGVNFKDYLQTTVSACDILLVVIGKQWLTVTDEEGHRRLDQPNDFVAIEVEAGLKRSDMRVIPLLVDGASMPGADDLPPRLSELHFRNAMRIRHNPDFNPDMDKLIQQLTGESSSRRSLRRLAPLALGLAVVVAGAIVLPTLLNPTPDTPASPTPGATATVAVASATPLSAQTPAAADATESLVVRTSARWVNVYASPQTEARILTIVNNGDSVQYDPASLTDDGWLMIELEDGTGWVRAASVGYQPCLIADGFDSPVGTDEERASDQIWPGDWFNSTPFAELYFIGTPNEAYHTGVDLNLPEDADRDQPIYAIGSGEVVFAQRLSTWGNIIVIQHDPLYTCDGEVMFSRYTQVGDILVQKTDRVERGQMITTVGNSNAGFDYKLHFDLSRSPGLASFPAFWPKDDLEGLRENFVDPRQYIEDHRPRS